MYLWLQMHKCADSMAVISRNWAVTPVMTRKSDDIRIQPDTNMSI